MATFTFVPLNFEQSRAKLDGLGHFHPSFDGAAPEGEVAKIDEQSAEFRAAVRSFQRYAGLSETGKLSPKTLDFLTTNRTAEGFRLCGCPDIEAVMELSATQAASGVKNIPNGTVSWPDPKKPIVVAYNFQALPGLSKDQTKAVYQAALDNINENCGVNLQLGSWSKAHVRVYLKGLGGGTLAIARLSMGHRRLGQHFQNYDSSNRTWSVSLAQAVIIHETLHTLGFSHSRNRNDILYPTTSGRIITMQAGDRKRTQHIYGPPIIKPGPDPDPGPGGLPDKFESRGIQQVSGHPYQVVQTFTRI